VICPQRRPSYSGGREVSREKAVAGVGYQCFRSRRSSYFPQSGTSTVNTNGDRSHRAGDASHRLSDEVEQWNPYFGEPIARHIKCLRKSPSV